MISLKIPHGSDKAKDILASLSTRIRKSRASHSKRRAVWADNEDRMVAYIPEQNADAIRRLRRDNKGMPDYTTIQLPYTYALVTSMHSYLCQVFLNRSPVFMLEGLNERGQNNRLASEALLAYQLSAGSMLAPLYIWLQDQTKYGEGWVTDYWAQERVSVSSLEYKTEVDPVTGDTYVSNKIEHQVRTHKKYDGNKLTNLHPSKVWTDPRLPRHRFAEGEFVAVETQIGRATLLAGKESGQYINVDNLPRTIGRTQESDSSGQAPVVERPDQSALQPDKEGRILDIYPVYEFCIEIIPKNWGFSSSTAPEKWFFSTDTQFTTLFECRPCGLLHGQFPLSLITAEVPGYGEYERGVPEIYGSLQNTLDWLVNSHFFNVRQVLNSNFLFDPSRVEVRDFQTGEPGIMARLKPAAYGSDPRTALHQIPVNDVTQSHFADMNMIFGFGGRMGINDMVQGQQAPSSRRSAHEIRGDQTFGTQRLATISSYSSASGWQALTKRLVSNNQQFYDDTMKLRIAGDQAKYADSGFIGVSADTIAGQYDWVPVDGTLPIDNFAMMNLWKEVIAQMSQIPAVYNQYDLGKLFSFVAQLGGIKNLNSFKVEVLDDTRMLEQRASGNSVPIPAGGGNPLEPGQVPGVGPTA